MDALEIEKAWRSQSDEQVLLALSQIHLYDPVNQSAIRMEASLRKLAPGYAVAGSSYVAPAPPKAAAPPRPSVPYTPLAGLSTAVVWIVGISAALALLAGLVTAYVAMLLGAPSGKEEQITSLANMVQGVELLRSLLYIAGAVPFLFWVARAACNLKHFGAGGLQHTPSNAVVGFFIPFLNLFHGPRVMNELWKGSDPTVDLWSRSTGWKPAAGTPLVGGWWGGIIAFGLSSRLASTMVAGSEPSLEQARMACWVDVATTGLYILSAYCLIQLVRTIAERNEAKVRQMNAAAAEYYRQSAPQVPVSI